MRRLSKWNLFASLLAVSSAASLRAQTTLTGTSMALDSGGSATMSSNGYLGTYLVVPSGGATINFTANATEGSGSGSGSAPHMNISIADSDLGFSVASTSATNYTTSNITLPAGMYLVSDQRDYSGNIGVTRSETLNNFSVNTVSGSTATFSNVNTDASGNALAAANTYITNFRQGPATVTLSGPNNIPYLPGTPVTARLASNAFNFGTNVSGSSQSDINTYIGSNPTAGSTADYFQQFINTYFNAVVPSNVGKWGDDEATQNSLTMGAADTVTAYAKTHQMMARMHNLIWGNQQPTFVNTDLTNAQSSNPTTAAAGLAALNTAITNRIGYYVGGGDTAAAGSPGNQLNTVTGDVRAKDYSQIDVLNEALLTAPYWTVLGASGTANVYKQVATAAANAGANVRLYTNEYNVLQFSTNPSNSASDPYANWYRNEVESINNAGYGQVATGVGVQYYPTVSTPSPSTVTGALANLAVEGLPISITEYGEQSSISTTVSGNTPSQAQTVLDNALRLAYGNPNINTFMIWGWWNGATSSMDSSSVLVNTDWKTSGGAWDLTPVGNTFVTDMGDFNVSPQTIDTSSTGGISFTGTYGSYYLSGQQPGPEDAQVTPFDFSLNKGTTTYNTTVAKPTNWFFWTTNAAGQWTTSSNWTDAPQSGTVPNTAGFTAYFGSSATTYNLSTGVATTTNITKPIAVTISNPVTVGMLVFDSSNSYTLNGDAISLQGYNDANGNVAAIYLNTGSHTINAPLTLLSNTTATVVPPAGTLSVSGGVQSASASLAKAGPGIMSLAGTSSVAGGVSISAGQLNLTGGTLATPSVTVNAGTFNDNGGILSVTNLTDNGTASFSVAAQSTVTLNGSGTLNLNPTALTISGGGTFSGPIAGTGAITVSGGALKLSNTDSYSGATSVTGGSLELASPGALATSSVSISTGATFTVDAGATITSTPNFTDNGTATFNNTAVGVGALNGAGTLNLTATALTVTNGGTFSGPIAGNGSLTVSGGAVILSNVNTYSGATGVTGGSLEIASPGSIASTSISVSLGASLTVDSGAAISSTANLTSNGTTNFTNTAQTIATLNGSGALNLNPTALTISGGGTFSGPISGSGAVTISGGTLEIASPGSIANTSVSVSPGASLTVDSGAAISSTTNLNNNGTTNFTNAAQTIATLNGSGTVNLNPTALAISNGGIFSGPISGSGAVTISGGTLELASSGSIANTSVSVSSGASLQVDSGATISSATNLTNNGTTSFAGSAQSIATLNGSGTLNLNPTALTIASGGTFTGPINGPGTLTLTGGTLTLSGSASASALTVNASATLNINGSVTATPALVSNGATNFAANAAVAGPVPVALASMTIGSTGTVTVNSSPLHANRTVVEVGSLTFANTPTAPQGLLNLMDNDLIVHNGNLSDIISEIAAASDEGQWNGSGGITSSVAAAAGNTTLAAVLNDDETGTHTALYSTFDGQSVVDSDVLVKYTFFGDANFDGVVDASDYLAIDNGFNSQTSADPLTGWQNGDFNSDGFINGDDYTLIDNAFNSQGSVSYAAVGIPTEMIASDTERVSAVPEPTTLSLFGLAAAFISLPRKRRRA
jgi:autotransporter-associated beta strand protein